MHATQPHAPPGTEPQLSSLVEGSPLLDDMLDAVIMTDLAFRVVRWNRGAVALYGWSEAEALGQAFSEIAPTVRYMSGQTREALIQQLQREHHWRGSAVQRHRDGHELSIDSSVRMLYSDPQTPIGVIAVNRDITERLSLLEREQVFRTEAETARHRLEVIASASRAFAEARLALPDVLMAIATQVAHLIGDNCVLRLLSDDGTQLLPGTGYHWDAAARYYVEQVLAGHPRASNAGILGRVVASGQPLLIPVVPPGQISADGNAEAAVYFEKFPIHSLIVVPLRIHDRIIGVFALARDMTKRAYVAEDLTLAVEIAERAALAIENARLYQAAQDAVKVRETFLSIAAHELRTPLTSLLGHVMRLTRRAAVAAELNERDMRSLEAMTSQGKRINALIEELLDVSRLQLGRFKIARGPVDMVALVQQILRDMAHIMEHYQLTLELPAPPVEVHGDPQRLEQVVTNVLGNAVKYSLPHSPIGLSLTATDSAAVLTVTDQGVGIPDADLPKLFTQFFRASNVDPQRVSGLGIGLFLAREIVDQHGGTIDVQSVENAGTTVRISLPRL